MLIYYSFHIGHAGVTDFKIVLVENFAVPVCRRKMLANQFQKVFYHVCGLVHTEGGVKPNFISESFPLLCGKILDGGERVNC